MTLMTVNSLLINERSKGEAAVVAVLFGLVLFVLSQVGSTDCLKS